MGISKRRKQKEYNMLSADGLISYFRDNLKNPTDENVLKAVQEMAKPDADQEHLKDGKLPWGWHTLNKEFTDQISSEFSYFINRWINSKALSPREEYAAMKDYFQYVIDAKKLCYSKNECFAFWFDTCIMESSCIEKRQSELMEMEKNLDELQAAWEKKQNELKGLDKRVFHALKENEGILQSEFVKLFDACVKTEISEYLYTWDKEGKITRDKSGRSYILRTK